MKKIIYGLVFGFMLFVGINNVNAAKYIKKVCYYNDVNYKLADELDLNSINKDDLISFYGNINIQLIMYSNNTAEGILLNSFSEDDGYYFKRKEGKSINVKVTENTCPKFLTYTIAVGSNTLEASTSYTTYANEESTLSQDKYSLSLTGEGNINTSKFPTTSSNVVKDVCNYKKDEYNETLQLQVYANGKITGYEFTDKTVSPIYLLNWINWNEIGGNDSCPDYLMYLNNDSSGSIYSTFSITNDGDNGLAAKRISIINSDGIEANLTGNLNSDYVDSNDALFEDTMYKQLVCQLHSPLSNRNLFPSYNSSLEKSGNELLIDYSECDGSFEGTLDEAKDSIEESVKSIKSYCNNLYSKLGGFQQLTGARQKRIKECTNFDIYYTNLVNAEILDNYKQGCGLFSTDLTEKINMVFDIIKIAGPILAVLLGMVDFIKAVTTDDVNKESKNVLKRFLTRIMAAILLFVIPAILSILLNIFIDDKIDTTNPFCIETDTSIME